MSIICSNHMPDRVLGTKDMAPWLREMDSGHLLTNEKDTSNKKLQIKSELLMKKKIQCCWSIQSGDVTI